MKQVKFFLDVQPGKFTQIFCFMLKTELFGPVRHRYVVFRYKSLRP